jgi:hypothetical protein
MKNKFKVGDTVRIKQGKDISDFVKKRIGKIGKVVYIDDTDFPYNITIANESDLGFAEDELAYYSQNDFMEECDYYG